MNIQANTENLSTRGKEVQSLARDYQNEVTKIYSNIENLRNAWSGQDNQAYINKVNEYKADIEKLGKVIDSYGLFLVETARNLENIQNEIASQAGKL